MKTMMLRFFTTAMEAAPTWKGRILKTGPKFASLIIIISRMEWSTRVKRVSSMRTEHATSISLPSFRVKEVFI